MTARMIPIEVGSTFHGIDDTVYRVKTIHANIQKDEARVTGLSLIAEDGSIMVRTIHSIAYYLREGTLVLRGPEEETHV